MTFYRLSITLMSILICYSIVWAAPIDDIESRFIYPDYSKKISLDFRDVPLIDALKIFSKQSGMNFISGGDVSAKRITLFLDGVPVEEALEKILDANGLTYEMSADSNMFIVKTKPNDQKITKIIPLKFATVTNSKLNSLAGGTEGASTGGNGLLQSVKDVLSKEGKVEEDARTNSLVITDFRDQFPLIEETITKIDVPVVQILIEVEMLDVSKSASDQIGISYGQTPLTFQGASREVLYPWDQNKILRKGASVSGSSSSTGSSSGSGTSTGLSYTAGVIDASGMTAALDFLKTQNDTRSLARPRLLTLNNQPAHIEISTDESLSVQNTTTSIGNNGAQSVAQVERKETGVMLDVVPQANANTGEILMTVSPQVKESRAGALIVQGQPVKDVETRKSESILKVRNGETVIIGGLLRTQDINSVSKLPFLGDLPLVGGVFRHRTKLTNQRELIIFITPHIVDDRVKQKIDNEATLKLNREIKETERLDAINNQLDSHIGNL